MSIFDFLPDSYYTPVGTTLRSMLDSLDEQDGALLSDAVDARRELFITTASGKYLISLASQYGFVVPRWAGLDTNGIRQLAIPSIFLPKQSKDTFRQIVEAFYSKDILHPSFICSSYEPYALADGDSITFKTESAEATVTFRAAQISNIAASTAGEVASILNAFQTLVFADVVYDRTVNAKRVRITSNSYGVESSLRISGGSAQNIMKFPNVKEVYGAAGTTWTITKEGGKSYSDVVIFTYSSGFSPDLFNLDMGDVLTIRGFEDVVGLSAQIIPYSLLNGSYEILDCGMNTATEGYFKISNLTFQLPDLESFPLTYAQASSTNLVFTSAVPRTIYNNREYALIVEPEIGDVVVSVPPVPPLTRLYLEGSMHLHGSRVLVTGFTRDTITVNGEVETGTTGYAVFESKETIEQYSKEKRFYYTNAGIFSGNTIIFLANNRSVSNIMPFISSAECEPEFLAANIENPVYLEIESNVARIVTPDVPASFEANQEITIEGVDLSPSGSSIVLSIDGGMLNSDFNKNHIVSSAIGAYEYHLEILDSNGNPKKYTGAVVVGFDIYSVLIPVFGSDIIFRFATESDRIEAGFVNGMKVRVDKYGTILNNVMINYLRDTSLSVMYQTDNEVYLSSSRGVLFDGPVVTGGKCRRSAYVGGTTFRHYIVYPFTGIPNNWNYDHWYKDSVMIFLNGNKHSNSSYVGSYVYDPVGTYDPIVVSSVSAKLDYLDPGTNIYPFTIRERDAIGEITVDSVEGFPPQGQIMVGYGTSLSEGPISYTSYSGSGPYKIFIDRAYVFKYSHGKQSEVRLIRSSSPIELTEDASDYPTYVVDAMTARDLVADVLKSVSASGIRVSVEAQVPVLKYYEPVIDPFVSQVG